MTDQIKETIYQVTEDVLERLAFMFSFREEERGDMNYSDAMIASVTFGGDFEGRLFLAVSPDILPELAGNMLGIDEETTQDQQQDALKELINVICGNLLPRLSGKRIIFNVNAPQIVSSDEIEAEKQERPPLAVTRLSIEEGACDLIFFTDGEIPPDGMAESDGE